MSKIFTLTFLALLAYSCSLTKRSGPNESCHAFKWCDHGLACVNYRCVVATEDNLNEKVEFAPKGPKCAKEIARYCPRNYHCVDHRCYSDYLDHPMYDPEVTEYEILKKVLQVENEREAARAQKLKQQQNLRQKQQQQLKAQQPQPQQQKTQTVQQILS